MTALHHPAPHSATLAARCAALRAQTEALVAPLSEADCQLQSMPDASPGKWHLAQVTRFFETFLLERHEPGCEPFHEACRVRFNSCFMVNQMVLRGGFCATPRAHIRSSCRNFSPTDTRWQFNGLHLARDES
jgi:hypothetical protein